MDESRIKVGLLGVEGAGEQLLTALQACDSVELIALADRDRDLAAERAHAFQIEFYDDYRSLVVEQPIQALFVAAPPFACQEQLKAAAARGIPVWRETPFARSVRDGKALLDAFAATETRFSVSRRWQFTYQAAGIRDVEDLIGRPYAARGIALEARADPLGWRGDTERSGGGALMDRGYEVVDAIVQRMGLPDEVQATTARRWGTQPYDTDDVAAVTLRYQNGSMANVLAQRRNGPETWGVTFDGLDGSLTLQPEEVIIRGPDGRQIASSRALLDSPYIPQIEAYAKAIRTSSRTYPSPAHEHLATVAVIETAYLSARTGEPESPDQLYHLHDIPVPARPRRVEEEDEDEYAEEPEPLE